MREVLPLSLQFRICDELDLQAVLALRTCSRAYLELATKVLTRKLHEVVQPFVSQEEAFVACLDSNNAFIWGDGAMSFLLRDEQITVDTLQVSVDHEHWQDLLNHLATMEDAYEVPCPLISPTAADDWAARHGAESVITMRTPTGDIHIYRTASHQMCTHSPSYSNYTKNIMDTRFPALAQRVYDCEAALRARGEGLEAHATPQFGTFYNYCINGPREGIVDGVSTGPHVDGKNLALMFCAVFVWGKFDHTEKAWLVLWEAKLIIELPPGVLMYYPSSLFTHFNVDMSDLNIVTTADGARPTPANSSPLKGVPGRGSVVFFNQATMFQLAENGCSVKDARAQGLNTNCDNSEHLYRLPTYNL